MAKQRFKRQFLKISALGKLYKKLQLGKSSTRIVKQDEIYNSGPSAAPKRKFQKLFSTKTVSRFGKCE